MEDPEMSDERSTGGAGGLTMNPMRVLHILRLAGAALFSQAALHGQLLRVEWAEEKSRLTSLAAVAAIGMACLLCMMMFAGGLIVALSWDSAYRIAAVVGVIVLYALGVVIAWYKVKALAAQGAQAFAATREELAADFEVFRSRP